MQGLAMGIGRAAAQGKQAWLGQQCSTVAAGRWCTLLLAGLSSPTLAQLLSLP
jgi:hypothetical protein